MWIEAVSVVSSASVALAAVGSNAWSSNRDRQSAAALALLDHRIDACAQFLEAWTALAENRLPFVGRVKMATQDGSSRDARALADKETEVHNALERDLFRSLARVRTLMPADAARAATALVEAERDALGYFLNPSPADGWAKEVQSAVLRAIEVRDAFEAVSARVIQVAGRT